MIPVTRPFFPPVEAYRSAIGEVWSAGWLTNHGPQVQRLEATLSDRSGAQVAALANGTLAIQLASRALGFRGRVATTPFSFVATTGALVWEGCEPVFVDIDDATMNLSPTALENLDADGVTGVLGTHVYGVCCDADAIGRVARERGWRVLYDAAHAFGSAWNGVPAYALGDAAAASFHATKLFHTGEGGAVISRDPEVIAHVRRLRSFGERSKGEFVEAGINAKMSELHAALGLAVLDHMDALLARRKSQSERYRRNLAGRVAFQSVPDACTYNHAYVPVFLASEDAVLGVSASLAEKGIEARRYFYPALSSMAWVRQGHTPVAEDAARRVLCLPLFHDLDDATIDRICEIVDGAIARSAE